MPTPSTIFDVMTVPAPDVPPDVAAEVARRHWGIAGTPRPLSGERDRNFHLATPAGGFVLKFANPAEPADFRAMQTAVLRHIAAADPGLTVPRVIPTADGAAEAQATMPDGAVHPVRLLSYVEGVPIHSARRSAAQRAAYGVVLGRLQSAMRGFAHPGAATPIIWDLQHALHLREAAHAVPDAAARAALEEDLAEFQARVTPLWPSLRRQVLHDDLNRANVMVDAADHDRIAGVIDFGDTTDTAVIMDITIAANSQQGDDMDIVEAASHMLRAYTAAHPIPAEEAALLGLLMRTRMMMGITLSCWHRLMQPDNLHHGHYAGQIERILAMRALLLQPQSEAALMAACGHG